MPSKSPRQVSGDPDDGPPSSPALVHLRGFNKALSRYDLSSNPKYHRAYNYLIPLSHTKAGTCFSNFVHSTQIMEVFLSFLPSPPCNCSHVRRPCTPGTLGLTPSQRAKGRHAFDYQQNDNHDSTVPTTTTATTTSTSTTTTRRPHTANASISSHRSGGLSSRDLSTLRHPLSAYRVVFDPKYEVSHDSNLAQQVANTQRTTSLTFRTKLHARTRTCTHPTAFAL